MKTINIKNITRASGNPSNVSISGSSFTTTVNILRSVDVDYASVQFDKEFINSLVSFVSDGKILVTVDGVVQTAEQIVNWNATVSTPVITPKDIYVSSSGDDSSGDGTSAKPYKTITKAYSLIPKEINSSYTIKIANGVYADFPNFVNNEISPLGQLAFDGYEGPVGDGELYEVSNVQAIGDAVVNIAITVTLADANFTVDSLHGKYLKVTSTDASSNGMLLPIFSNTSNTVVTLSWAYGFLAIADSVEIVSPGVEVETDYSITFGGTGSNSYRIQAAIFNIGFEYVGIVSDDCNYLCKGTISWGLYCVNLINECTFSTLEVQGEGLNLYDPLFPDDISALAGSSAWGHYKYSFTIQEKKNAVPTAGRIGIFMTSGGGGAYYTSLNNACSRDLCEFYSVQGELSNSLLGSVTVNHGGYLILSSAYVNSPYYINGFRIGPMSNGTVGYLDLGRAFTNGIILDQQSSLRLRDSMQGISPTGYNIRVGSACQVVITADQLAPASINNIYFNRTSSAHAYPAAGSAITDNQGSYVLR